VYTKAEKERAEDITLGDPRLARNGNDLAVRAPDVEHILAKVEGADAREQLREVRADLRQELLPP